MSWFGMERLETSKYLFCTCLCKIIVNGKCEKSVAELEAVKTV